MASHLKKDFRKFAAISVIAQDMLVTCVVPEAEAEASQEVILSAEVDSPVIPVGHPAEAVTSRTHISYIFSIFPVINRQNIKYRRLRRI